MKTETTFLAVTATMRLRIATTIEALVNLLDAIDGDENLEASNDDEYTNGWPANGPSQYHSEAEDRELDTADDEPSLGRLETVHQGANSYRGASDGRELDNSDLEPSLGGMGQYCYVNRRVEHDLEADGGDGRGSVDDEPSLGWTMAMNQDDALAPSDATDLEAVNEDGIEDSLDAGGTSHGIADQDALHAM